MSSNAGKASKSAQSWPNFSGSKILLVDDSTAVRDLMRHYLAPLGATILEAADGTQAIDHVTNHSNIAIILLDVHMPGMDGLSFATEYQKLVLAGDIEKTPIIMVTTETTREMAAKAQQLGISGWIVKPPRQEILLDVVTRMAKREHRAA